MLGGSLYCVIVGGAFLGAGLFAVGTIVVLYAMDKWSKRKDPGAPGFLEMDRRGTETRSHEDTKDHEDVNGHK